MTRPAPLLGKIERVGACEESLQHTGLFFRMFGMAADCRDIWIGGCALKVHAYHASKAGVQMHWGFIASLAIAILAIVGVFADIPIISNYAFWVMTGAYVVLAGAKL